MYHYYDKKLELLPKSKDGNLNYGLVRCMMALDLYKQDGDQYKQQRGIVDDTNEGKVEF